MLCFAARCYPVLCCANVVLCTLQVSHDQYLIEATVDELWMCEGGEVTPFHGTFLEYKQRLKQMNRS